MNTKLTPDSHLVLSRLWARVTGTGLERFELCREADGWALRGTILALEEEGSAQASYDVVCDAAWRTIRADISVRSARVSRALHLRVDEGRWFQNGTEMTAVRGCIDIDLSWTPSTNTLPIRRLNLAVGAGSGPLTAAWVRFPQLTVEPLPQEYQRIGEQRFEYSSRGGAFTAVLGVDGEGVVLDYGGVWRQIGP